MNMSVTDHLEELRWRIIRCIIYVIVAAGVSLIFTEEILNIIKLPSKGLIENFLILKPAESIAIYIKTALFAGLAVTFPQNIIQVQSSEISIFKLLIPDAFSQIPMALNSLKNYAV